MSEQNDVFGTAGMDYLLTGNKKRKITVWSNVAETDHIPVHYLFRKYTEMPLIEQQALLRCKGQTLDVGACMGAHSLWLQNSGIDVTALEISPLACEVMRKRGIRQVVNGDFLNREPQTQYNTILILMNGAGIAGTISGLPHFFEQVAKYLAPDGQLLLDSTDIHYLFADDDGSMLINLNDKYCGELIYRISFGNLTGNQFPWLFIDSDTLAHHAKNAGFNFETVVNGTHCDYLARLTKNMENGEPIN